MKTDSGNELAPLPAPREWTAADAKACVDSWGPVGDGTRLGLHMVARALRAEVARLEAQVLMLQRANTSEVNARRAVMANYDMAADQVHALRDAVLGLYHKLNTGQFAHMIVVTARYSKKDVLNELLAICKDPPNGEPG